jgi:hypothetical protein
MVFCPRILGIQEKVSGPTTYIRIYSCGDVPRERNTGGCAPKGGQQPVSQVMRQAQQVICGWQTGQLLVFQCTVHC